MHAPARQRAGVAALALPVASLKATTDDAKKLAGTLGFDKTSAGGPRVDVQFDAALVKEVTAP